MKSNYGALKEYLTLLKEEHQTNVFLKDLEESKVFVQILDSILSSDLEYGAYKGIEANFVNHSTCEIKQANLTVEQESRLYYMMIMMFRHGRDVLRGEA